MDMYDSLYGDASFRPARQSSKKGSARGGVVTRSGLVVKTSEKAVLFFDDLVGYEYWVPKKSIIDWMFSSGDKRGLSLFDLDLDDEISFVLPKWLLIKERVI